MRTFTSIYGLALSLLLLLNGVSGSLAVAADSSSTSTGSLLQEMMRLSGEVERINAYIIDLESDLGPYDRSLLEPLDELAAVYAEMGDFNSVNSVLERRVQLVRTAEGPSSLNQLAIVRKLITNDFLRQDWQSVANRFELIDNLYSQNEQVSQSEVLQAKHDVALWSFAQLYLDQPSRKIRHFKQGRDSLKDAVDLAEELYGEDSMELVPWLYREAVLKFQVAAVILADDELGVDARDEILRREGRRGASDCLTRGVGSPFLLNEFDVNYVPPSCRRGIGDTLRSPFKGSAGESFLREGISLIERIGDIARTHGELEAEAMALTNEADFRALMGSGSAAQGYRQAMDKFIEAGVSRQQVNEFFQRPVVLPVTEFYPRIEDVIAAQDAAGYRKESALDDQTPHIDLGNFYAWSDSLPFAAMPALPDAAARMGEAIQYHTLDIEFTLGSQGYTRNPDIIQSSTDGARIRRDARQALKDLRFRPYFLDGRRQRVENMRLRYRVPVD